MSIFKNTPTKGQVRLIVFRDLSEGENAWYGVALDFNIVVSSDSKEEAHKELIEAVKGYIHVAKTIKGLNDFSALNQKPEQIYLDMWEALSNNEEVPSPYSVDFFDSVDFSGKQVIHA